MTQASEQRIYEALMEFRHEQAGFNAKMQSEFDHIKKNVASNSKIIGEHQAIKDRAVGAMWLSALIGSSGILAWLYSLFVKTN